MATQSLENLKKPNFGIIILNFVLHHFCVFFDMFYLPATKMVTGNQALRVVFHPVPLAYMLILIGISLALLVVVYKKLMTYDGSEEKGDSLSKMFKNFQTANVGIPVLSSIIYTNRIKYLYN